jgi:hypothetical protein
VPTELRTIDGIIHAMYETISGPAGAERDWGGNAALFAPGARLTPVSRGACGEGTAESFDVDGYRRSRAPYFAVNDFYESEVARRVERYGCVAHAFSTYESRRDPSSPPFMRGVNSIQMIWEGGRWWITSVAWQHEAAEEPLPAKYLAPPSA